MSHQGKAFILLVSSCIVEKEWMPISGTFQIKCSFFISSTHSTYEPILKQSLLLECGRCIVLRFHAIEDGNKNLINMKN